MPRIGKIIVAGLLGVGLPVAVAGQMHDVVQRHPLMAITLAAGWEALVGAGFVLSTVVGKPAARRLEEIGNAFDRFLGQSISKYGSQYRRWVMDSRRFLESRGLATVGDFTPELDEVFIDVSLAPRAPHQIGAGMLAKTSSDLTRRYSIWDFLGHSKPVVLGVIGAPGSGKTTLLSHIARRIVQTPAGRRRRIPILLQLRDHVRLVTTEPSMTLAHLMGKAMSHLPIAEPQGWWERQLKRGRCVVLLDGLDEVADVRSRRDIATWIDQQISIYSGNDYVITSRPHGYRAAVISAAVVLQVRPFTNDQVKRFLYGWYLAVERRATGTTGREVEILVQQAMTDLLDRLAGTPGLYDLTENPLLLTMIANVHRYRGSLPGSRADLYGEVCQVMLWRRQEAKRLVLDIPGPSKERLLADLAYKMMRRRTRDLPRQEVLDAVRPGLARVPDAVTPEDFLADVGSNGLLVERENGFYAFVHLTFQEYLAAKHIQDRGLGHVLAESVDDVWWREVTLLYVTGADADPIARACLKAGTPTSLSLAFECTEADTELAPDLRQYLRQTLVAAFRDGADAEHRRLVAGVLAARHLRRLAPTSGESLVCPHPITGDIYRLFLADSGTPLPDGRGQVDLGSTRPITGVWGGDAALFVAWVNVLAANTGQPLHRLPTEGELQDLATRPGPAAQILGSSVTGVWARSESQQEPRLWVAPGRRSPRLLSTEEIQSATLEDVARSRIMGTLVRLAIDAISDVLEDASRQAVHHASAIAATLARTRRFTNSVSMYQDLQPVRDHAHDLTRSLSRDRQLTVALDRALRMASRSTIDASLASGLPGRLASYHEQELVRSLGRAVSLDRELSIAMGHHEEHGLIRAYDDIGAIDRALGRARDRAVSLASEEARQVSVPGSLFDHALAFDHGIAASLKPSLELVLASVVGAAFARAFAMVLGGREAGVRSEAAFARSLVEAAGFDRASRLDINLDELSGITRHIGHDLARRGAGDMRARRPRLVAERLVKTALPVFERRKLLDADTATAIRLQALSLAVGQGGLPSSVSGETSRKIVGAVTLLQKRAKSGDPLETIVLARA